MDEQTEAKVLFDNRVTDRWNRALQIAVARAGCEQTTQQQEPRLQQHRQKLLALFDVAEQRAYDGNIRLR